ncbi:MAG: InlB B-repeat-containing protein [Burkholderiales bacterium]|nr:InlB B-repeat-containing protein [Burkholderiales bacterium]
MNFDDKGGIGGAESTLSPYTVNAYLGNNIQPYFSNSVDTPSKEGYHFMGYYSAESGGDQYFDEDGARVLDWNFWTTPVTLHARFVEVYTVEYLGGGNTGGTAPTDATEYFENDEVTVLNEGSLVKTGYTFTGWKDQDGNNHAPNSKFTIEKNMTLTAQWLRGAYTVNVGTGGVLVVLSMLLAGLAVVRIRRSAAR